ncbi:MAG: hypothetical protein JSS35_11160 [Proteobacteria bacterium]|nr:hypothetical protein [Pseudomonadota bacterium]
MTQSSGAAFTPTLDPAGRPRRPILHLKARAPEPPAAPANRWKCKPCGGLVEIDPNLEGQAVVRCPACSARLGRAEQFRGEGEIVAGVRARRA